MFSEQQERELLEEYVQSILNALDVILKEGQTSLSLVMLFIAYKVVILLMVIYEITECRISCIKQILNIDDPSTS